MVVIMLKLAAHGLQHSCGSQILFSWACQVETDGTIKHMQMSQLNDYLPTYPPQACTHIV